MRNPIKIPFWWRRWVVLLLACLLFVLSQFYRASVAVITPNLIADLGLDPRGLSLISAAFFYAFAVMQIPLGIYLDSLGARVTMTVLSLLAVAGTLIFAWGDSLEALVFGRILLGVGMACNLMGTLKLITFWFGPRRFATLSALAISVGTVGNVTAATPLVYMVQEMGWRETFTVFAAVNFFLTVVFFIVVRDRPTASDAKLGKKAYLAELRNALAGAKALLSQRDYWAISLGTFCRYGIFAAVQALWAGPYLMNSLGFSQVMAGHLLFLMSIGVVLGGPVCGWISDSMWRSRKRVIIFGLIGMAAVLYVLSELPADIGAAIPAVLFFTFGVFSSTGQIMYAHIKEGVPLDRAGTAMTGINFFTITGAAVFLQGLGQLMESLYPGASLSAEAFRMAFLVCTGCLAVTGALYATTSETLNRRRSAGQRESVKAG